MEIVRMDIFISEIFRLEKPWRATRCLKQNPVVKKSRLHESIGGLMDRNPKHRPSPKNALRTATLKRSARCFKLSGKIPRPHPAQKPIFSLYPLFRIDAPRPVLFLGDVLPM